MGRRKSTKSTYGQGSIYQDKKSGRWIVQVPIGNGKTTRKRVSTLEAAQVAQAELIKLRDKGVDIASGKQTLREFAEDWFRKFKQNAGLKPRTLKAYLMAIEVYIGPGIGNHALQDVRPENVHGMISQMRQNLSPATVRQVFSVLNQIMKQAERWNYIDRNPCDKVERVRSKHVEPEIPTIAQARQFLDGLNNARLEVRRMIVLYHLAIRLGLRRGELLGLMWSDISWTDMTIRVARQYAKIAGPGEMLSPKSESSKRILPLTPSLAAMLRVHYQAQQEESRQPGWENNNLLFPNKTGQPCNPITLTNQFGRLAERTEFLRGMHFHLLRHMCASYLIECGASDAITGAILGHSSSGNITRRYVHVPIGAMRRAVEAVEAVLFPSADERMREVGS